MRHRHLAVKRIAGKFDEEIRVLVTKLEAARKTADQQPLLKAGRRSENAPEPNRIRERPQQGEFYSPR